MTTSTENTTPSQCEQVLDYAYDELEGDAKAAFEQHLQTCAKCQAELAQLKRVRGAVKAVLPRVEPPANATGALHAQLLHAAAQRASSGGGKVIPFGRRVQKVMMSPAFLAAAMFVLIGGAAGTMWWRGHLLMPERALEATAEKPVETPPAAPMPAPVVVTATPSGTTAVAGDETTVSKTDLPREKKKEADGYYRSAIANEGGEAEKQPENKVFLGLGKDSAPMTVHRAPPATHAGKGTADEKPGFAAAADKPADLPAPPPAKKGKVAAAPSEPAPSVKTRKMDNAALDGLSDDLSTNNGRASGGSVGGVSTGSTTSDLRSRRDQASGVKSGAKREEIAPQGGGWNGQVSSIPPKASSAPAAAPEPQANQKAAPDRGIAASPPTLRQQIDGKLSGPRSSNSDQTWKNTAPAKEQQGVYGRNYDSLRKQALDFADSGRCPDAVKLFDQMQKDRWGLSQKELVAYKRCKTKLEEATKQDKNFQNRMMQDAERVHEDNAQEAPQRMATPKPAPPAQTESQQAVKSSSKAKKRPAADSVSDPAAAKPGL